MPFARGYHIEIGGGRGMPGAGALGGYPTQFLGGGYGVEMKTESAQAVWLRSAFLRPRRNDSE